MSFKGFETEDFDAFNIEDLEGRMAMIQERIQPKFHAIAEDIAPALSEMTGREIHLHVAKHARRKVNPPADTWSSYCHNKRGYKQHPHFQIGLFDDHVFIWLAFIYELPHKREIANRLIENKTSIKDHVPGDFMISLDHTKKDAEALKDTDLDAGLQRFRDVKKGEFLIGRQFDANDPILQNGDAFIEHAMETFKTLIPVYQLAMRDDY
ncbi:YktB family protein [Salisediminibacterium beveridgei]|uniref:UPF0637 protein BBEV_1953 n=1 Tax=Salisediminibacterium beveridgei TaxID=632773 RepID=A0A1D7QWC7_9BACI|nr:DUF1054 domain-containing protein [Salisediminibacterium beveridgei]AOM83314.1 hypothetical protein BBEV_1953 [Salisediminibacterium beveridgei]